MREGRVSQTALKVALTLVTLGDVDDWAERLPDGLVDLTETLLVESGVTGYGRATIRAAHRPWMVHAYGLQDKLLLPRQFEGFGHRKVFVDDQVSAALAEGAGQVLVIGAGFDTLCLRKAAAHPDVTFVEVDHPATSAAKAKGIDAVGRPDNLVQVAADLGKRGLSTVMSETETWDPGVVSVLVAEGLLMYLSQAEVRTLFAEAADITPSGSRFAVTHMIPEVSRLSKTLVGLIGEPFRFLIDSAALPSVVDGTGWTVTSEPDDDPAHGMERYAVLGRSG